MRKRINVVRQLVIGFAAGTFGNAVVILAREGPLQMLGFLLVCVWAAVMVFIVAMTAVMLVLSRRDCGCGHSMLIHGGDLMGGPCQRWDCDCMGRSVKVPTATGRRN